MLYIKVQKTKNMGWGVFSERNFKPGEIIEICPCYALSPEEIEDISPTNLEDWFYEWGEHQEGTALVMGYGMIYNHSDTPNASYEFDFTNQIVTIRCLKDINKNEQIFINYNQYQPAKDFVGMFDPVTNKAAVFKNGKLRPITDPESE